MKEYNQEELTLLHAELYDILSEVIRVCNKHNISYFAIGGTAIGALYDQAILPWDDDIDIAFTRENYEKFLEVADKEYPGKYKVLNAETDENYVLMTHRTNGSSAAAEIINLMLFA